MKKFDVTVKIQGNFYDITILTDNAETALETIKDRMTVEKISEHIEEDLKDKNIGYKSHYLKDKKTEMPKEFQKIFKKFV